MAEKADNKHRHLMATLLAAPGLSSKINRTFDGRVRGIIYVTIGMGRMGYD
jgi:hypothetical protein